MKRAAAVLLLALACVLGLVPALPAAALPAAAPAARAVPATRATPRLGLAVAPRYPHPGAHAYLTGTVGGRYGRAHGWVRFRFDGRIIADCRHVPLRGGVAHCTAPTSFSATRHFALGFFGSAYYRGAWELRVVHS